MKLVQIGVGKMGRAWLKTITSSDVVELAGIVEPVAAAREWAMNEYRLPPKQCFDSIEKARESLAWDAAVVVTPPPPHRPIAERLLQAGKHVLLEKPMATTMADARALVDIAADTGKMLMVAQNYRFHEAFNTVRALVAAERIGAVRAVTIQFHKDARTMGEGDFRYVMRHPLLTDMSIHHFDMIRAMFGANAAHVYARTWHVPDGNFEFHAAASVLITMDDGVVVSYTGNWAAYLPETSWSGAWEIVGERGRIVWDGGDYTEARISVQEWGEEPQSFAIASHDKGGLHGLLEAFARALESGIPPETSAADNVNSLGIVFAAIESSETGRVVTVKR